MRLTENLCECCPSCRVRDICHPILTLTHTPVTACWCNVRHCLVAGAIVSASDEWYNTMLFCLSDFPACRYEKGAWGDCNAQSQMTRNDKLKPNSDPSCEQNRQITKKCKAKGAKPTKGKGNSRTRFTFSFYLLRMGVWFEITVLCACLHTKLFTSL